MCCLRCDALTEINEKASIALALVLWKNHDARYIVFLLTVFLLEREGETQEDFDIRKHIMEPASQSRPVWAYSRVLMKLMKSPLTNCHLLAPNWNVNGSTCNCKLARVVTEITIPQWLFETQYEHLYVCRRAPVWRGANAFQCPVI